MADDEEFRPTEIAALVRRMRSVLGALGDPAPPEEHIVQRIEAAAAALEQRAQPDQENPS